jgi:hypothetical protein
MDWRRVGNSLKRDLAVIADRLLDRPQSFIERFLARGSQWIAFSLSGSAAERLSDLPMAPLALRCISSSIPTRTSPLKGTALDRASSRNPAT